MRMDILSLVRRDFKKAMNLRTLVIWIALAGMGVFFFYTSGGKTKLVESDQIEFLALFLPHMIFGSWAVLSSYFDLVSSDREHNVLDCIICSGIPKTRIFISKVIVAAIMSLVLSFIYMTPVTCVIIGLSGNFAHILVLIQYLLPLWGYIMVFSHASFYEDMSKKLREFKRNKSKIEKDCSYIIGFTKERIEK